MKTGGIVLLVALAALAGAARGDIFQWEWVDPGDHTQGKRESATLCPDGAGNVAKPFAYLRRLNLTQAYLIAANLVGADFWQATLTAADLTDAEVWMARFGDVTSRGFTAAQLYSTASYKAKDLTGIGLGQNDLSGWNVAGQNLTYANFAGATLTGADLSRANLRDAAFVDATLTGADLGGSNLTDAVFLGATLAGADLTDAEVRWASFADTTGFTAVQLYATASYKAKDLMGIGLDYNDLSGWNFADQDLTGAHFQECTLTGADLTDAEVRGAWFSDTTSTGFTAAQLYSTASYKAKDLAWIRLRYNDLAGWDFAGQNLTGAEFYGATLTGADLSGANLADAFFYGATLTGADLSGANLADARFYIASLTGADLSSADARGAEYLSVADAVTANMIRPDGSIHGLDLADGRTLVVRDYDGESAPLPVHVSDAMTMGTDGVLRMVFDADDWGSLISFDAGIPVALGGTLELTFAPGVDVPSQVGRTLTLFDWSGVTPSGAFSVSSPQPWDLSNLYTTGDVTLLPEPATLALMVVGLGALGLWRRGGLGSLPAVAGPPRGKWPSSISPSVPSPRSCGTGSCGFRPGC